MKRVFGPLLLAWLAIGCTERPTATEPGPDMAAAGMHSITGTLTYRERVALTHLAQVEIVLEEVSRLDAAGAVVARKTIADPGQVPIRFELAYPAEVIDPRSSYALRARISDRGRLMFTTDTPVPVLARGAGEQVRLSLLRVSNPAAPGAAEDGRLRGMFQYLADAAQFRDCRDNERFAVSMEGAYIEVERAYLNSGIEAGNPVLIEIKGRYLERPSIEGNHNEVKLIIDTFYNLLPDEVCAPQVLAELVGTYWKLIEIGGVPTTTPASGREPHFMLDPVDARLAGHTGCNNFFGRFETRGAALSITGLGSTMMACADGMETEQGFMEALGETTRFEISGEILTLYAGDRPLARFEATYL